jgi:hypothetical protein
MPILREWRAEIRRPKKAAYVEYVRTTGIAFLRARQLCFTTNPRNFIPRLLRSDLAYRFEF